MNFEISPKSKILLDKLKSFMDEHVYPAEDDYYAQLEKDRWQVPTIMEALKIKARDQGLWNLFLPDPDLALGLSNSEYAPLCEIMGRSSIAPEVFNCNAPDTGNMELLWKYGTPEQKKTWLEPLLEGVIRSAFCMTEPDVASSDATNISTRIERDGDQYILNGRKWWCSNAAHPRCDIFIVMGKTDASAPRYNQQSQILVPRNSSGVRIERALSLFGYDDAPHGHCEVAFDDVRVPASNLILGEGRGFEIAQGRLGPGRIHHCMRLIGLAERALEKMCLRAQQRTAFSRLISEQGSVREKIAQSRIELEQARLLVLKTAWAIDQQGAKAARGEIAMIKVIVPNVAQVILDRAMQIHGAAGFTSDFGLAAAWASARSLRMADGPDEVHAETVAKLELRKYGQNL